MSEKSVTLDWPTPPAEKVVKIDYTNHRGERSVRQIQPLMLQFGMSMYHPKEWVIVAYDLDKCEIRHFALKSIHNWGA